MGPVVHSEIGQAREELPTLVALIGLLARVCPQVSREGGLAAEAFPTLAALVEFHACVDFLVIVQR